MSERRRRLRLAAKAAGWTLLWSVFSPATLILAPVGFYFGYDLTLSVISAAIGGAQGVCIALAVAIVALARGRLSLRAILAACGIGVVTMHTIMLDAPFKASLWRGEWGSFALTLQIYLGGLVLVLPQALVVYGLTAALGLDEAILGPRARKPRD